MFQTEEFDEFDNDDAPLSSSSASSEGLQGRMTKKRRTSTTTAVSTTHYGGNGSATNTLTSASSQPSTAGGGGAYRFHTVHDAQFSPVASVADGTAKGNVSETMSCGELWNSATCHCLKCDLVRAMAAASRTRGPLIILDLDNYGFPQFRTSKISLERLRKADAFFWCFYGACFERHFKVNPEQYVERTKKAQPPEEAGGGKASELTGRKTARTTAVASTTTDDVTAASYGSFWHSLGMDNRVYFTPCGGHSQAVDQAMIRMAFAVAAANATRPVLFVSCDRGLGAEGAAALQAGAAEAEKDDATNTAASLTLPQHRFLNPLTFKRSFEAVWKEIEQTAAQEEGEGCDGLQLGATVVDDGGGKKKWKKGTPQ